MNVLTSNVVLAGAVFTEEQLFLALAVGAIVAVVLLAAAVSLVVSLWKWLRKRGPSDRPIS